MRERELANILVDGTVDGEKRVALKNDCSLCVSKRDVRRKEGEEKEKRQLPLFDGDGRAKDRGRKETSPCGR